MVGIDSDRLLPADRSIYVGENANFNLVMFPVDYECVESDFSCDTAGVTLSLLEGYTNVLHVAVADTITPGTEVNIFFRSQKIMHVTAVAQPVPVFTSFRGAGINAQAADDFPLSYVGKPLSEGGGLGANYARLEGENLSYIDDSLFSASTEDISDVTVINVNDVYYLRFNVINTHDLTQYVDINYGDISPLLQVLL